MTGMPAALNDLPVALNDLPAAPNDLPAASNNLPAPPATLVIESNSSRVKNLHLVDSAAGRVRVFRENTEIGKESNLCRSESRCK